ncbi:MAG: hypothetical protein ACRDV3_14075 [Acidothermaceae bacterium]
MPVDLAIGPAEAAARGASESVELVASPNRPQGERVVILRRRSARAALLEAELRGAPEHEVRLLEEAAIAANVSRVRAALREGGAVTPGQRAQFERDRELMRRFPDDRRGAAGEGWFHLR